MTRPPGEGADVIRRTGSKFLARYRQSLSWAQVKVLAAIVRCRTAALGGHRDRGVRCGYQAIPYNSCRNRHCPKCQTNAREKWLHQRQQELLPVGYPHLVFSVPHSLVPLVWQNKRVLFTLLFVAAGAALLEMAADPKHLGAEVGFLSILHTWGQTLQPHPHLHGVVPGGGLSPDHQRWIASGTHFFLPVKVLSRVFRGRFVAGLRRAAESGRLAFHGEGLPLANPPAFAAYLRTWFRQDGVVYAKPPFGGPEHVLHYLARYIHRVAIFHHRILAVTESHATFRWKDSAPHSQQCTMTLAGEEFLRRFLQHVLPKGFPRIRSFGRLANRRRKDLLPFCRLLCAKTPSAAPGIPADEPAVWLCPYCQGPMQVVERLTALQIIDAETRNVRTYDSSSPPAHTRLPHVRFCTPGGSVFAPWKTPQSQAPELPCPTTILPPERLSSLPPPRVGRFHSSPPPDSTIQNP